MYVFEHPKYPGKVIRSIEQAKSIHDDQEQDSGNKLSAREKGIAVNELTLREGRHLFTELSDKYGVETAGFMPVLGESDIHDNSAGYVVSDKIEGYSYKKPEETDLTRIYESGIKVLPEHKQAAVELIGKLTQYLADKVRSGESFLDDIFSLDQYVFTHPDDEHPHGKFVLVDVDPPLAEWDDSESAPKLEYTPTYARGTLYDMASGVFNEQEYQTWQTEADRLFDLEALLRDL